MTVEELLIQISKMNPTDRRHVSVLVPLPVLLNLIDGLPASQELKCARDQLK